MMRIVLMAAAAALALAGCAVPQEQEPSAPASEPAASAPAETSAPGAEPSAAAPAEKKTVPIVDFTFKPAEVTVPVGTTVEWVQKDDSLHTVDFEDGEKSGDMEKGATYTRTFDKPGRYPYLCFYHPRMTGVVTVQ